LANQKGCVLFVIVFVVAIVLVNWLLGSSISQADN
jgi:hypothetical protein